MISHPSHSPMTAMTSNDEMQKLWTRYLDNAVAINKKWHQDNGDEDNTGTACWDMAETVVGLFAGEETKNQPDLSEYIFEGMKDVHHVVVFRGYIYQMYNGVIHTEKFQNLKKLKESARKLIRDDPKEGVVLVRTTHYRLKNVSDVVPL